MRHILDEIVANKKAEVDRAKRLAPIDDVRCRANAQPPPRDFYGAITAHAPHGIHLIAEIKRRSPSAGIIRDQCDHAEIARLYQRCGASAISVLTDGQYFDGHLDHIGLVKEATTLPVLRKDFLLEEYQLWEARAAGADAVLLISEVLGVDGVCDLALICKDLGMTALVEAYDIDLMRRVLDELGDPPPSPILIGINNRDLTIQQTDLATTARLANTMRDTSVLVAESGIRTREDVIYVQQSGAKAMLVGETIMGAPDMAAKISELLGT